MRLVVISKSAFVQCPSWMATGWELLKQASSLGQRLSVKSHQRTVSEAADAKS